MSGTGRRHFLTLAAWIPPHAGPPAVASTSRGPSMKPTLLAAFAAAALVSAPAIAQQAAAPAGPATVTFTDLADMPGLTDPSQKNHFTVGISDPQVDVQFK